MRAQADPPMLLTAAEAADLLRLSLKALYVMVERGQVPGVIRLGRRLLLRSADLLQWLDQNRAPSQTGFAPRFMESAEELRESRESLTPKPRTDSAATMQREQGLGEMALPASPAIAPEHLSDSPAAPSEEPAVRTAHFFGDTNEEPASLGRRFTRPPCPDGPMAPTAGEAARHSGDDDAGSEVTR